MTGLLLLLLASSALAQYSNYYTSSYYSNYYNSSSYYTQYYNADCDLHVPEGLSVPTMCFMYMGVGECRDRGYDPHELDQYKECLQEILPEEDWAVVEDIWNSEFGPAGEQAQEMCSSMGYDLSQLNHYAVCLEHIFGIGYEASNEAFLGVEIVDDVPEIDWGWEDYYYYNPDHSLGPDLPDDPIDRILALMHGMAAEFLPGYDMCPVREYMCSDRSCIPESFKCDGYSDCWDGTDELFCGKRDWYDSGSWGGDPWYDCYIEDYQWCDGYQDCAYDEDWCDYEYDPWYECNIMDHQWCDGYQDCAYDEDWCHYENDPWYACDISDYQWCDGYQDCAYDEDWCDYDPWYACDITDDQWCDGVADCAFDEEDWCHYQNDPWYACDLMDHQWCDGYQDCAYDEDWCDYTTDPWYACDIMDDQWCDGVADCAFDEEDWCDYDWDEYEYDPWYACDLTDEQWCDGISDCAFDESSWCAYVTGGYNYYVDKYTPSFYNSSSYYYGRYN